MLDIPAPARRHTGGHAEEEKKAKKPRDNEPRLDLQAELQRICGVDLTSIDGIDVMTAFTIVSEIGTDVSRFQDENHFTSWLGLTPSKDISGGKIVGRGKKKVKNRVAVVLRTAATTLLRSDSSPGSPISSSAPPVANLQGRGQSHGPLSCSIDLPPADQRRSVGRSRRGAV